MKKNTKRILAVIGVLLLALVFLLFMAAAVFGDDDLFRGALGAVIILPILLYAMLLVYNYLKKKSVSGSGREIDSVIFDVGNVLLSYNWKDYLKSFAFPKEEYDTLAKVIFESDIWQERDRGALPEEDYIRQMIGRAPQYEKDIRLVMQGSNQCMHNLDYAEAWVSYLKSRNLRLYILSNYSRYALDGTMDQMTFLKDMNDAIFSCDVKQIKPEDAIFLNAIETFHLTPQRSVFIDDRPENCQAARKNGLRAIQFKDFKQAANDLEKLLQ